MSVQVIQGDCLEVLRPLDAGSVDAVVTDPPYGLQFMGKEWDHGIPGMAFWSAALRVLKPGGYAFAFGGTRTYHRLACAVEDAGFEVRDCLMWLYGSGFPKGKGCLKPAYEPIILARRPGPKVLPLGIDESRVGTSGGTRAVNFDRRWAGASDGSGSKRNDIEQIAAGRWPANVAHDGSDEVLEAFAAFGERKSDSPNRAPRIKKAEKFGWSGDAAQDCQTAGFTDNGTAARFFYCAKASRSERGEGNNHPTVKPLALLRWLVRLACPPGQTILDPFAGSGTTGVAALAEGRRAILVEREPAYVEIIRRRLAEAEGLLFSQGVNP